MTLESKKNRCEINCHKFSVKFWAFWYSNLLTKLIFLSFGNKKKKHKTRSRWKCCWNSGSFSLFRLNHFSFVSNFEFTIQSCNEVYSQWYRHINWIDYFKEFFSIFCLQSTCFGVIECLDTMTEWQMHNKNRITMFFFIYSNRFYLVISSISLSLSFETIY